MVASPDTIRWQCPECGKKTRVNLRTGLAYSHTLPASTAICALSAKPVVEPVIEGPAPELSRPAGPPTPGQTRYFDGPSTSVRAYSAGIPGTRRRG